MSKWIFGGISPLFVRALKNRQESGERQQVCVGTHTHSKGPWVVVKPTLLHQGMWLPVQPDETNWHPKWIQFEVSEL